MPSSAILDSMFARKTIQENDEMHYTVQYLNIMKKLPMPQAPSQEKHRKKP